MKRFNFILIILLYSTHILAFELDFPEPAPSFVAQKSLNIELFRGVNPVDLKSISFCYKREKRITIIYKIEKKYIGYFEIENNEKIPELSNQSKVSDSLINLWTSWLSRASYRTQRINLLPLSYAAAVSHDQSVFEGVLDPDIAKNSFASKMSALVNRLDVLIMMSELLYATDDELKKLPNTGRDEIKILVESLNKEIIAEAASLQRNLNK